MVTILKFFGPLNFFKVKFLKSPNQIRRYSAKEAINQVAELLVGRFPQEGTLKPFSGIAILRFISITSKSRFSKKSSLGLGTIFFMQFIASFSSQ